MGTEEQRNGPDSACCPKCSENPHLINAPRTHSRLYGNASHSHLNGRAAHRRWKEVTNLLWGLAGVIFAAARKPPPVS